MVQRIDDGGRSLSDGRLEQFNAQQEAAAANSSPVVGPSSNAPPAPSQAPNTAGGAPAPGSAEFRSLSRQEQIAIERKLGIAPGQSGAGGNKLPPGPAAPTGGGTRTAPPQPRQEPVAPGNQGGTRPTTPAPTPTAGRGLGGRGDVTDSRTFAQTGGTEARRRGITGNIQSGRSLFNNPGANQLSRGRDTSRTSRGMSLTRGTGGSPGAALSAPSGGALEGGGEEGGLEEILMALQGLGG